MTRAVVSVILPALDEEANVASVVKEFIAGGAQVVVVDNGSHDQTADRAQSAGAHVVSEPRRGYGAACLAGLRHLATAPPKVVVFADCDGSIDAGDLSALTAPVVAEKADLVLGRRARLGRGALPLHQRWGTRAACWSVRALYGLRVRDIPPFRALRWSWVDRLGLKEKTYGLPVETIVMAARRGARVAEVDVAYRRRAGGKSKVAGTIKGTFGAGARMLYLPLRLRFRRLTN